MKPLFHEPDRPADWVDEGEAFPLFAEPPDIHDYIENLVNLFVFYDDDYDFLVVGRFPDKRDNVPYRVFFIVCGNKFLSFISYKRSSKFSIIY